MDYLKIVYGSLVVASLSADAQVWKYSDADFQGTKATTYMKRSGITTNGSLEAVYNQFISPKVLTKSEAENIYYWWQDPATGEWHKNNIAEKATHPAQIMELLAKIYTDPNIPGTRFPDPRQHSQMYDSLGHRGMFKAEMYCNENTSLTWTNSDTWTAGGLQTSKAENYWKKGKLSSGGSAYADLVDTRERWEIGIIDALQTRNYNSGPRFIETMYTLNGVDIASNLKDYTTGSTTIKGYGVSEDSKRTSDVPSYRLSTPFPNEIGKWTSKAESSVYMSTTMPYALNSGWGASQLMREVYTGNVSKKNQWEHYDEVVTSDKTWYRNKHTYITPFNHGYTVLLVKTRKNFDWSDFAERHTYDQMLKHTNLKVLLNGEITTGQTVYYHSFEIKNLSSVQYYKLIYRLKDGHYEARTTTEQIKSSDRVRQYPAPFTQVESGSDQVTNGVSTSSYNNEFGEEMWPCFDLEEGSLVLCPRSEVEQDVPLTDGKTRLFRPANTPYYCYYDFDTTDDDSGSLYAEGMKATWTKTKQAITNHDKDYISSVCTGPYKDTYGLEGMEYADALYRYRLGTLADEPTEPENLYANPIESEWTDGETVETTYIYPNLYRGDAYMFIGEAIESVQLLTDYEIINDTYDRVDGFKYWNGNGDPYLEGKGKDDWAVKSSADQNDDDLKVLDHQYNPGIMYNIYETDMSRMHVIAKGSSAINDEWDMPFFGMFEAFSPSQPANGSMAYDNLVYQAKQYHVTHDCPRVEGNDHDLKFTNGLTGSEAAMRDVDLNFGFFIPNFRYEYFENSIDGVNSIANAEEYASDNVMWSRQGFVRYNPHHQPYFFCYGVKQYTPTAELLTDRINPETGKRQYKVTINWTPLNLYVDNAIATEYYVYEVEDGVVKDANGPIYFEQLTGGNTATSKLYRVNDSDKTYDVSAIISADKSISAEFYVDQPEKSETRSYVIWANVVSSDLLEVEGDVIDSSLLTTFNQVQSNAMSVLLGGNEMLNLSVNNSDQSIEHSYGDLEHGYAFNEYRNVLYLNNDLTATQCMTSNYLTEHENALLTLCRSTTRGTETVYEKVATITFGETEGEGSQAKYPFTVVYEGEEEPSGAITTGYMVANEEDKLAFEVAGADGETVDYVTFVDEFDSEEIPNHSDKYSYYVVYTSDGTEDNEDALNVGNTSSNVVSVVIYQPKGIITPHHFEAADVAGDANRTLKRTKLKYAYFPFSNRVDLTNYTVYHGDNQVARIDKLPTIIKTLSFHGMEDVDDSVYALGGDEDYVNKYYKDHSLPVEEYSGIARIPIYTPDDEDYNKYKIVVKTDRDGDNDNTYGSEELHVEQAKVEISVSAPESDKRHYGEDLTTGLIYDYLTWEVPGSINVQMPDAAYKLDDAKMRIWRTVTVRNNMYSARSNNVDQYTQLVYSDFADDSENKSTLVIESKATDTSDDGDSAELTFEDELVFDESVSSDMDISYTVRLYSYTSTKRDALYEEYKSLSQSGNMVENFKNGEVESKYINEEYPVGINGYLIDDATSEFSVDLNDDVATGVTDAVQPIYRHLQIYPVPADTEVTISAEGAVEIYNAVGALMTRIDDGRTTRRVNLSRYAPGVYIVKNGTETSRLIKK